MIGHCLYDSLLWLVLGLVYDFWWSKHFLQSGDLPSQFLTHCLKLLFSGPYDPFPGIAALEDLVLDFRILLLLAAL